MADQDNDGLMNTSREDVVAAMNAWASLDSAHLQVALDFWKEELTGDRALKREAENHRHKLNMIGLITAVALASVSFVSAIVFGAIGNLPMAGVMLGPSTIVVLALFVTRTRGRSDQKAGNAVLNAAIPPP